MGADGEPTTAAPSSVADVPDVPAATMADALATTSNTPTIGARISSVCLPEISRWITDVRGASGMVFRPYVR
jgi:hypothetical protein